MVLILSNENDLSTNKVIHWLKHYKKPFVRVNYQSLKRLHSLTVSNESASATFICDDKLIDLNEITGFWYRRGDIKLQNDIQDRELKSNYAQFIHHDLVELEHLIYYLIGQKDIPKLCSYNGARVNKMLVLHIAASCGLKIPDSFIAQDNQAIKEHLQSDKTYITKAISDTVSFDDGDEMYIGYTKTITAKDTLRPLKHPLLVQEGISKSFEVRSFYLDGTFYSMAVFSQQEKETITDSRLLNGEDKFIRQVPIVLPTDTRTKLTTLMKRLNINTGAIDLIRTRGNEYVFLEVNPVGQYDWMEGTCNYNIHQSIAKYLIT